MKKYRVHIVYLAIIAFFVVFAKIKADEAESHAASCYAEVNQLVTEAEKLSELAAQRAAEAEREKNMAYLLAEELEACKSGKK